MNFKQLKEILKNIKEKITCSNCECNFSGDDIYVLGAFGDKCVFLVTCRECETQMLVTATINDNNIPRLEDLDKITNISKDNKIEKRSTLNNGISCDDVLEVHTFLKDFDGDFKNLMTDFAKRK
jgi:hypothetical protein